MPSIANPTIHEVFDNGQWVLMPEDYILEKYVKTLKGTTGKVFAQRNLFPDFPVRLFII
jgi:hypothetical protein